jgi:3-oxoacyl-[acyl-carrier protein] reductase
MRDASAVSLMALNSLAPGLIETEGTNSQGVLEGDFRDSQVKNTPLGRLGSPDDIGPVAVFLVSDAAFGVNASWILAGGGVTM